MKVTIEVPEDIRKYIEFIPEEELSEIFVDIIRRDILSRHEGKEPEQQQQQIVDLNAVLNLLKQVQLSPNAVSASPSIEQQTVEEPLPVKKHDVVVDEVDVSALDIDDDFDDFMDLMK